MSERIYISEIKIRLSYKDTRSVIRWCINNRIGLYKDIGSKKLFAFRIDFESVYSPNRISSEMLNASMNFYPQVANLKIEKSRTYIPQGEHEKSYLSMLQNIIHKI